MNVLIVLNIPLIKQLFFRTGLGRAAFAFPSQANRTGVRLEANRERPPLQGGSRPADLVRIKVRWLHSHQRNRTGPRDQTRLVRSCALNAVGVKARINSFQRCTVFQIPTI